MAIDPLSYPIYRQTPFWDAFVLTDHSKPSSTARPAEVYEHAVEFLDTIATEASARGLELPDRLESQGTLWAVVKSPVEYLVEKRGLPPEEGEALAKYRRSQGAADGTDQIGDREVIVPDAS